MDGSAGIDIEIADSARPTPWQPGSLRSLRMVPIIGSHRPSYCGRQLIEILRAEGMEIACVLLHRGDPLCGILEQWQIPVLPLPDELCKPRKQIMQYLNDPDGQRRFSEWLSQLSAFRPDLGFSFFAWWMPERLFNLPRYGSLNLHPAPLPGMRGYEPETQAILTGREHMHGTLHRVEQDFDTGDIYWESSLVRLRSYETPTSLLERVTLSALAGITDMIAADESGVLRVRGQNHSEAQSLNLSTVWQESVIQWQQDSHDMIDRRLRAFNGQPWRIRLKAVIDGELFSVLDVETVEGEFPGLPGETIGRYPCMDQLAPVVCTGAGAAVVRIDHRCSEHPDVDGPRGVCDGRGSCRYHDLEMRIAAPRRSALDYQTVLQSVYA